MPPIRFTSKYTGAIPGVNLTQREWNSLVRDAWMKTGFWFHQLFAKKHFTKAGAREYGYAKRKPATRKRRKKSGGKATAANQHNLPLVFTGATRTAAKRANVKPFAMRKGSGVRITMRLPTLSYRPKGGQIDMIAEMTTISDKERGMTAAYLNNLLDKKIKAIRRTTTTVIK